MEPPPRRDRDARPDRIARELVAEADVAGVDLEQRPALGLLRRRGPVGQNDVEHGRGDTIRHDRDQLDQPPLVLGQPRDATAHGVRDRARQLLGRTRGEQLGDVERVASGDGVEVVCTVARERRDGTRRKRLELQQLRRGGHGRMAGWGFPVAAREQEQDGQRPDSPGEQGDDVERRLVRPVHVLEHEHGRLRRQRELGQQQAVDLVRRRAGGQRLLQRRRQRAGQVVDRAERPRDREVVAGAEQHARVVIEIGDEAGDERGLADPGLAGHDDDATVAPRCRDPRLREHSQCPFPLQELHASTINAPSVAI